MLIRRPETKNESRKYVTPADDAPRRSLRGQSVAMATVQRSDNGIESITESLEISGRSVPGSDGAFRPPLPGVLELIEHRALLSLGGMDLKERANSDFVEALIRSRLAANR